MQELPRVLWLKNVLIAVFGVLGSIATLYATITELA
jgi:hypothetical protein